MPPKETLRHREAFEIYYSMGKERSYTKVAQRCTVSRTTIAKWAKRYGWQERMVVRDGEIGKAVERRNIASLIDEKAAMLKLLKAQLAHVIRQDPEGPVITVTIDSQTDLLNTLKTMLLIMGEDTSREGGSAAAPITVITRVPDCEYDNESD